MASHEVDTDSDKNDISVPLWLKSPLWFKQLISEFLRWTGRCCLYPLDFSYCCCCWLGTVSLTINQSFLQLKRPRKHLGLSGFLCLHWTSTPFLCFLFDFCSWLGTVSLTINLNLRLRGQERLGLSCLLSLLG